MILLHHKRLAVSEHSALRLWIGGPIEPQRGWILLDEEPEASEAVRVCNGVYLSASVDLLRRLLEAEGDTPARLLTGYAGWAPGQLEAELAASSWLTVDVDPDLVFRSDKKIHKWSFPNNKTKYIMITTNNDYQFCITNKNDY